MAVVKQSVDQGTGHEVVAEDLAPFVKEFVRDQNGRGSLIAASYELEEEHGAVASDRQVADLVDHEERRMREGLKPLSEGFRPCGFESRSRRGRTSPAYRSTTHGRDSSRLAIWNGSSAIFRRTCGHRHGSG